MSFKYTHWSFLFLLVFLSGCSRAVSDANDVEFRERVISYDEFVEFERIGITEDSKLIFLSSPDQREPKHLEWIFSVPIMIEKPIIADKYSVSEELQLEVFESRGLSFEKKKILNTWSASWNSEEFSYECNVLVFIDKTIVQIQRF
ncbi:MAG: hypothetical protein MI748_00180 [Opitutales bacterium]|nr:hypothetical protein [Opitutales bacterium]